MLFYSLVKYSFVKFYVHCSFHLSDKLSFKRLIELSNVEKADITLKKHMKQQEHKYDKYCNSETNVLVLYITFSSILKNTTVTF